MKTKKNWFVIVAAMIMSSVMIFASCSSDDDPMLPEVIESEVLDKGMDDTASSKPSINPNGVTTGTQFSYKSWIMVKGQTRAAFENKVEVTLNNVFANTDTVITVSNFDLGDYKTVVSKRKRSERQEGFVTVSDSVMVYSVQFAEFSFDYELDFEHAVYNDGVTKQNMPYHPIGTIKDNGYKLEELDFVIEKEVDGQQSVYLRKLLRHSISVAFNGKTYDLSAKVELRKFVGYHPCVVASEVVDKGIGQLANDFTYSSWIKVKQSFSDKRESTEIYQIDNMKLFIHEAGDEVGYFVIRDENIKFETFVSRPVREYLVADYSESKYIKVTRYHTKELAQYNYFNLGVELIHDEAVYDDGVTKYVLPCYSNKDATCSFTLNYVGDNKVDDNPCKEYDFIHKSLYRFGITEVELEIFKVIYIYK